MGCLIWPATIAAGEVRLDPLTAQRADGSELSYYVEASAQPRQDAILILQGTGCREVASNGVLTRVAELLSPERRLVLANQPGVSPGEGVNLVEGCPPEFWERSTLSQRVLDSLLVIAELRRSDWWSGRIVIFGGSEGGAVAALLAPLVPETEAVIIYSSGGGQPVRELIASALPPPIAAQVDGVIRKAKANPTGAERWGGLTYKWWADAADVTPVKALALSPAPTLLIHGARDVSSPVASARMGYQLLRRSGKRNVRYLEYPALDHFMKDAAGVDHLPQVMEDAREWLSEAVREEAVGAAGERRSAGR